MSAKKISLFVLVSLLLGPVLFPQTLAEIAQKERERRASLKGKKAVVVTNADLAKLKKKPAVEIPASPVETQLQPRAEEPAAPPENPPPAEIEPQPQPPAVTPLPEGQTSATLQLLQERWEKAKEYIELLTMKMGALWQQYNGMEGMTPKETIQGWIAETFIKLQKAEEEEAKAREELEKFLTRQKRESTPQIWIR
ncbi:MAG: hypothetical protein AB1715_02760 [Acidobacteriota bacterium]